MKFFKTLLKYLLAALFIVAGAAHFIKPSVYLEIMPSYIPYPLAMVLVSGAAEVVLGFLLVFRRMQRLAAWGLIALLIAVFPANLHMALHPELFPDIPAWSLYARLPLQGVFILWAYWYSRP